MFLLEIIFLFAKRFEIFFNVEPDSTVIFIILCGLCCGQNNIADIEINIRDIKNIIPVSKDDFVLNFLAILDPEIYYNYFYFDIK